MGILLYCRGIIIFSEKKVYSRYVLKKAEYLSSPLESTNSNARFLKLRSTATRKMPSENVVPQVDLNHCSSALCAPLVIDHVTVT